MNLLNLAPMMAGRWPSRAERNRRNPTQYKGLYKMDDNSVMAVAFWTAAYPGVCNKVSMTVARPRGMVAVQCRRRRRWSKSVRVNGMKRASYQQTPSPSTGTKCL